MSLLFPLDDKKIVDHALDHFDQLVYGLNRSSIRRARLYICRRQPLRETFKSFETDHVCNPFCRTFGLPMDYHAKWDIVI